MTGEAEHGGTKAGVAFALDMEAVACHLKGQGLAIDRGAGVLRLSGGLANINDLIVVDGRKAVLRRPPMGELPPGAHDMVREHRVLSRLSRVFAPAPDSFFLCEDRSVIGVPFQLLEFREGLVVRGDALPSPFDSLASRRALSEELVRTLAALHSIDAASIGLGDFGKPEGFFARNVRGWLKRGEGIEDAGRFAQPLKLIGEWLAAHEPPASAPALLHSDFKLDNCMLTQDLRIGTMLDWDMSTRGDPLMDLATLISYWAHPGDPACMHRLAQMPTAAEGFLSRAQVIALYGELSGRDMGGFHGWRVLAMLKLSVVFLQLYSNWKRGVAGDARYAGFLDLGSGLLDYTLDLTGKPN